MPCDDHFPMNRCDRVKSSSTLTVATPNPFNERGVRLSFAKNDKQVPVSTKFRKVRELGRQPSNYGVYWLA